MLYAERLAGAARLVHAVANGRSNCSAGRCALGVAFVFGLAFIGRLNLADDLGFPDQLGNVFLPLSAKLKEANQKIEDFFRQLYVSLGANQPATRTVEKAEDETAALQARMRKLGAGTVAVYTLVAPDRYRVIVITPNIMVAREYPISAKDLRRKVFALTEDLQNRHSSPLARAQELYNILVAPIENDLEGATSTDLGLVVRRCIALSAGSLTA